MTRKNDLTISWSFKIISAGFILFEKNFSNKRIKLNLHQRNTSHSITANSLAIR